MRRWTPLSKNLKKFPRKAHGEKNVHECYSLMVSFDIPKKGLIIKIFTWLCLNDSPMSD
jgi:hypothetical protein